ncbi:DUF6551 family protein [Roseibium album]|uniref:DUF6551 family protein n=1 Tax=Roseibium album TaxID=311410 RepID=UPI00248FF7D1|nr:DUF6551 family protein [Roseibium album]
MEAVTAQTRPIEPIAIPDLSPGLVAADRPDFRNADPASLLVDVKYQRNLSGRSLKLIRKIVSNWDWAAFKPPVCVDVGGDLHVVDGQHTATAAATHPGIALIPVMIVKAEQANSRAAAFVKHNRDRVNVTPMQLHYSLLASGDEEAIDVARACQLSGVTILRQPPAFAKFKEGETLAIEAIKSLVKRRFIVGARKVLDVCVEAKCAPVSSDVIKAVEALLFNEEYAASIIPENLATTIRSASPDLQADIASFKLAHRVPKWRAMAVVYFRNTRKKRRAK